MRYLVLTGLLAGCGGTGTNRQRSRTCQAQVWSPVSEHVPEEMPCLFSWLDDRPGQGSLLVVHSQDLHIGALWDTRLEGFWRGRPCLGWSGSWRLELFPVWPEPERFSWKIRAGCRESGGNILPFFVDVEAEGDL